MNPSPSRTIRVMLTHSLTFQNHRGLGSKMKGWTRRRLRSRLTLILGTQEVKSQRSRGVGEQSPKLPYPDLPIWPSDIFFSLNSPWGHLSQGTFQPDATCMRFPSPPSPFCATPFLLHLLHCSAQIFAVQCHLFSSGNYSQGKFLILQFCFSVFFSPVLGRPDWDCVPPSGINSLLSPLNGPVIRSSSCWIV